jgi:phosphate starvation-inducible protein PhoH and related proteins
VINCPKCHHSVTLPDDTGSSRDLVLARTPDAAQTLCHVTANHLHLVDKETPLGISALTPPTRPDDVVETALEFPDNRLLIELCGEFDRNLAQVEHQLGVHVLRRGNRLAIIGDKPAREQAAAVLRGLYARLEAGRGVAAGDVDGAIRMGRSPDPRHSDSRHPDSRSEEQIEMFHGAPTELRTRKRGVEPRTEAQKAYVANLFSHELGFGIGPAGTGKTYLAVAVGVTMFISGAVEKIILSRPAVEAGERLGFLPGDMKEKIDPYMQPLYDALNDFLPGKQVQKLLEEKRIEIAPLAFMRGRTLSNAFIVLDEAQNATQMQMKMFLTRLGEGSRMVITGDRTQVDLPRGTPSGLSEAERILAGVKGVTFNYFTSKDVVRHPLVGRIIEAYEADEAKGA